jgi:hypothetical protein
VNIVKLRMFWVGTEGRLFRGKSGNI